MFLDAQPVPTTHPQTFRFGKMRLAATHHTAPIAERSPAPRYGWRDVDSNGHEHYCDNGTLPTLQHVADKEHWCDGTEGMYRHDPHVVVDEFHYECVECGEQVEPDTVRPGTVQHLYLYTDYELTGPLAHNEEVTVRLAEEEGEAIVGTLQAGNVDAATVMARDLLVSAPPDKVTGRRITWG